MSKELENEQRMEEAIARASSQNPEPVPVQTPDSSDS